MNTKCIPIGILGSLVLLVVAPEVGARSQTGLPEWVVQEVLSPNPEPGGTEDWAGFCVGDLSEQGFSSFLFLNEKNPIQGSQVRTRFRFSLNLGPPTFLSLDTRDPNFQWEFSRFDNNLWAATVIQRHGSLYSVSAHDDVRTLVIRSLSNPTSVIEIPPPPPPPNSGLPALTSFGGHRNAGDITGDGCDDIFFQSLVYDASRIYHVAGLLDGLDGSALWMDYDFNMRVMYFVEQSETGMFPDFNGDGFPDLLAAFSRRNDKFQMYALSGIDGTRLWDRKEIDGGIFQGPRVGIATRDLNLDGTPDIVSVDSGVKSIGKAGQVQLIDGRDGTTIWTRDMTEFETELLPDFGPGPLGVANTRCMYVNAGEDGWDTPIITVVLQVLNWNTLVKDRVWLHLDPSDGHTLGHTRPPATLAPWSDEQIYHPDALFHLQHAYLLGDIDRDGFVEYAVSSTAVERFGPTSRNANFAVIGRATLKVPEQSPPGTTVTLDFHLPSAPDMTVAVVASGAFSRHHGFKVDGWDTHLALDPILQRSLQQPLTGLLDAQGKAQLPFHVYPHPRLSGRTLWLRGLVKDPRHPNRLHTMTTLASTELQ